MKITFEKIKIINFMSFKDAEITFSNKGYTSVIGVNRCEVDNSASNGSGKSTIFEAISWCLTGETIRGSKDVRRLGSKGFGDCGVILTFTIDSDEYIIDRRYDPSKLFVTKNNIDISGKGIRDTAKILSELLPDLTPELIGSVIILGQGLPQRFSNNTPSGRKEILEKLSKSDFMIDDIKQRIANRKSILSAQIRENEDELVSKTARKNQLNQDSILAKTKLDALSDIDSHKTLLESKQAELKLIQKQHDDLTTELNDIDSEKSALNEQILKLKSEKLEKDREAHTHYDEQIRDKQSEVANANAEYNSLRDEIYRIKSIKDVCPTCGQKLPNIHKPSTESQEIALSNVGEKFEKLKSEHVELMNNLADELSKIDFEYKNKTSSLVKSVSELGVLYLAKQPLLSTVESNIKNLATDISHLETAITTYTTKRDMYLETIESCTNQVKQLDNEILYINNVIDNQRKHLDTINKFETCVKRDFRGHLLSNIIVFIDKQAKSYCKDIFNTDKIQFKLDGNNISISYADKEYECLSGGEKQKVDLIVQFSLRDMLCKYLNFSSNILVLDEITDNLDNVGCQNVFNLISKKLKDVESVYIISHHIDLQFPIDYELTIEKGQDGISRIQQ